MVTRKLKTCHKIVLEFPKLNQPCDCWYFTNYTAYGSDVAQCVECSMNYLITSPENIHIANAFRRDAECEPIRST